MMSDQDPGSSIKRLTLAQQVYLDLKKSIITHNIPPGSRLNELELAKKYQVSPTPVREALNKLRGDGLIQYRGWQGACVIELNLKDIKQLFNIRCELECLAVREAFPNIQTAEVERLMERLSQYENRDDFEGRNEANEEFHGFLIKKAGDVWLAKILNDLKDILLMARYPLTNERKGLQSHLEHLKVLKSIQAQDLKAAEAAMAEHINEIRHSIIHRKS
jgi:DNA-binding GntR family transcriptional regulator